MAISKRYDWQQNQFVIITALAVLLSDQTIKFIIAKKIIFSIDIYKNTGALLGIPINSNLVFVFFIITFVFFLIYYKKIILYNSDRAVAAATGLVAGGIVSNLIDRILYGYVVDYINFIELFSFNVADAAICVGAVILGWKIIIK